MPFRKARASRLALKMVDILSGGQRDRCLVVEVLCEKVEGGWNHGCPALSLDGLSQRIPGKPSRAPQLGRFINAVRVCSQSAVNDAMDM